MAWTSINLGGQRAAGANIREDLSNMISNIDRDETPFLSTIGTNKATGRLHEWLTDSYANPDRTNAQVEGTIANATNAAARQSARRRLDNYTQIFQKDIVASKTVMASDTAGIANEFAYQLKKAGVELKRDIDARACSWVESGAEDNVIKNIPDTAAAAGEMGSIFTYAANWVNAATGTNAVLRQIAGSTASVIRSADDSAVIGAGDNVFSDNHVTAAGDNPEFGNTRNGTSTINFPSTTTNFVRGSFDRDSLEGLVQQMYDDGAKPSAVLIPSGLKSSVSAALIDGGNSGEASRRATAMEKKLNLAVMGVATDFNFDLALMPSYIMNKFSGARNALLVYDPSMIKRSILVPMYTEVSKDARNGELAGMWCEETLEVSNPKSVGVIVGL